MKKRISILAIVLLISVMLSACGLTKTAKEVKNIISETVTEEDDAETQEADNDNYESYESIYEEYAEKIRSATPGLIEEYNAEAKTNNDGMTGLATICTNKIQDLAEIETDGTQEMASFMLHHGSGKYEEYEEWANKLYKVYEEESQKITDVYMKSF